MKAIIVFVFFLGIYELNAQINHRSSDSFNEIVQKIFDLNASEDQDPSFLINKLGYFYENPIAINNASKEDLQQLGLLNDLQILEILKLREKSGDLQNLYELQTISGIDRELFDLVRYFLKITNSSIDKHGKKANHILLCRSARVLEKAQGYDKTSNKKSFLGNRELFYLRYLMDDNKNTKMGFTLEKDPGEQWFSKNEYAGFDFMSGFVQYKNKEKKYSLLIGDYHLRYGQGLVSWTGLGSIGSGIEGVKRKGMGITPYTSSNENDFFRGIAFEKQVRNFKCSVFGSKLRKDANLVFDEKGQTLGFSSLKNVGRHHLPSEILDKDVLIEENYGGAITYLGNKIQVGVSNRYLAYNQNYLLKDGAIFNKNFLGSLFYDVFHKNYNFFGEICYNWLSNGYAIFNGAKVSLDPKLSLVLKSILVKDNFFSAYGGSVRFYPKGTGESNFDVGLEFKPSKEISVSGFTAWSNGMSSQSWKSKTEKKSWLQIQFENKKMSYYLRYTFKDKQNFAQMGEKDHLNNSKNNLRINFNYKVSHWLSLKNRIEFCSIKNGEEKLEKGFLMYQDLKVKIPTFSIVLRYALFNSDSYASGIYAYENDLTYVFYTPNYSGYGNRVSLVMNKKLGSKLSFGFKLARWLYNDRLSIGSGGDKINANHKTELKLQLKLKM